MLLTRLKILAKFISNQKQNYFFQYVWILKPFFNRFIFVDLKKLTLTILLFCLFQSKIYSNIGHVLMSPVARFEKSGDLEYGLIYTVGTLNEKPSSHSFAFLSLDMLDKIKSSLFFNDGKFSGAILAELFQFSTYGAKHKGIAGLSSYKLPAVFSQTNQVIFQESILYSLTLPSQNISLELGAGRDVMDHLELKPIVGLQIQTNYALLRFEWDSQQVNIGLNIPIQSEYNSYMMFTPQVLKKDNSFLRQVSFGLGSKKNIWEDIFNQKFEEFSDHHKLIARTISQEEILKNQEEFFKKYSEKTAEKTSEKKPSPKNHLILTRMQNGLDFYYQKQYERALNEYLAVISMMPDLPIAYTRVGSIYHQLGKKELAIQYWDKAYELDPSNFELADILNALKLERKNSEILPEKK